MKIGVVGVGQVGAASAFACVMRGVGSEVVLVDHNPDLAVAQAEDILHATPFASAMPVTAGGYDALEGAGVVMVAAGVPQKDASETRLALLKRNADVFRAVIPAILARAPGAVLLIASNPVDVMTALAAQVAAGHGVSPARVIGSGTMLDTARFRALVAAHLGVSAHSVHAHVLGEHGDSEVLHWSGAEVGALPLREAAIQLGRGHGEDVRQAIDAGVRRAAYRIIAGKGATWFGIGAAMARLAEAVIGDQRAVLTCTTPAAMVAGVADVSVSLPRVVGRGGVLATLTPVLTEGETALLAASAGVVKAASDAVLA
jgi:L-lactate dehydrogenase